MALTDIAVNDGRLNFNGANVEITHGASENPVVPLPATLPLFATGLGALGLLGWRERRHPCSTMKGA